VGSPVAYFEGRRRSVFATDRRTPWSMPATPPILLHLDARAGGDGSESQFARPLFSADVEQLPSAQRVMGNVETG
jgi:hypothetical protein